MLSVMMVMVRISLIEEMQLFLRRPNQQQRDLFSKNSQ